MNKQKYRIKTMKKQVRSTDLVLNSYSSGGQKFDTDVRVFAGLCCKAERIIHFLMFFRF